MKISELEIILLDKDIKAKIKVEAISEAVLNGALSIDDLINVASRQEGSQKGSCVEALEFATRRKPEIADKNCLTFVIKCLGEKAPRVKWEAAKVIGNIAHLYQRKLDMAVSGLLENAEHSGTVVRWSSAYALAKILSLKTSRNKHLIPATHAILSRESDNAIKKLYIGALKNVVK